jgi:hypothetical protein
MKTERIETDVVCDRPGCGRRVTAKGGKMATIDHHFLSLIDDAAEVYETVEDHIDLCRECHGQMVAMWLRKAGDE